jgi:hypothetical protein
MLAVAVSMAEVVGERGRGEELDELVEWDDMLLVKGFFALEAIVSGTEAASALYRVTALRDDVIQGQARKHLFRTIFLLFFRKIVGLLYRVTELFCQ